jgi:uncharacterized protein YbjT (DUF2867 family)
MALVTSSSLRAVGVEDRIRSSGLDYTVIRVGVLVNQRPGEHLIELTQQPLPLAWRYRIARADVAEIFLAALGHPKASRTTFEAVWGARGEPKPFDRLLDSLHPEQEVNGRHLTGGRHGVA